MTWIDLSQPIFNEMPPFPGDCPVEIMANQTHDQGQMQLSQISMSAHTGTHLDAPRHFIPGGGCVADIPLDRLSTPALVASCPLVPSLPGQLLDLTSLDLGLLQQGDALLLATGWDSLAGTKEYFQDIPRFAPGSTEFLQKLDIRLLGLDLPTVCEAALPGDPFQAAAMHVGLLGAGVVIVESLVGLVPLAGRRVEFMALPLPLAACEGSPVRACARLLEDKFSAG
jgi:arylformamidase